MLNREIISASIPSLTPEDPVLQALDLMADFHVEHLPVISGEKFLGLVSENHLLGVNDDSVSLGSLQKSFSTVSVHADTHLLESVQLANELNLTVIPVVEKEGEYAGAISLADLMRAFGRITGVNDPGGLIVLEMEKLNFSFSEISKLVETNDAQITQLNTCHDTASGMYFVTIKLNKFEISDIVATFQRYEYQVKYYFGEELYENELRNNYDHLMNYLNI